MEDQYFFTLLGIVIGAFLSVIFSLAKELYTESRSKKKEAEYIAIRMICIFESFLEDCANVVGDDGMWNGQLGPDETASIRIPSPILDVHIDNVNWKSLPPKLMYEILYFPNLVKNAESYIDSTFDNIANPPGLDEGFEERQYQYSKLGILASELINRLREKYKLPRKVAENWDAVEYMKGEKHKIDSLRERRAAEFRTPPCITSHSSGPRDAAA